MFLYNIMWIFSVVFTLCCGGWLIKNYYFDIITVATKLYLLMLGTQLVEKSKISTSYVEYHKNDVKYIIAIPSVKGPNKRQILAITPHAEDKIDIDLLSYVGPYGNFHSIPTTPKMMGVNNPVIVTYKNGTQVEYQINEVISLNPPVSSENIDH